MKLNILATTALLLAPLAFAQDTPDVNTIVQKANHMAYYQGKDGRARVTMTIVDDNGQTRERELTILKKDIEDETDGQQDYYVYFHRPADVRGTAFLVHRYVGKDDDRWLYLPALDVVKRIAASDERTSFVGSHFFYEDVSGRGLDEDTHELVETTDTYYVLKHTPKDKSKVEFDSYTTYIHKDTFIPVKIEYEKGGEVYRTAEVLEVKDIQGYKTVTKARMTDKHMGGHTEMSYSSVEYDLGIGEDIFTERFLRKPPQEYLK
ncbi:MAG: outer membrane lipoprotein-sorting protein [Candidatus Hydrogenedentes bacterium]|nr:outer membrane lipoprotein-sorting protein [Candidatus Hydrogenedentota bacterium]